MDTATDDDKEATLADFVMHQSVEIHPCNDRWMMGDRFGEVTKIDTKLGLVRIKLNRSGKSFNFLPRNVLKGVRF